MKKTNLLFLAEAGYAVGHIGVHHIQVAPCLQERVPFAKWASNAEFAKRHGDWIDF